MAKSESQPRHSVFVVERASVAMTADQFHRKAPCGGWVAER